MVNENYDYSVEIVKPLFKNRFSKHGYLNENYKTNEDLHVESLKLIKSKIHDT